MVRLYAHRGVVARLGVKVRSRLEFDSQPAASDLIIMAIGAVVGGSGVHDARRPASPPVRVKLHSE